MAEARWDLDASALALLVNINRDPKKMGSQQPDAFNPYTRARAVAKPKIMLKVENLRHIFGC